jgi:ABC-2 type transport system ATP-binding protein
MDYVLKAKNISKYYQDKKVVDNITIELKEGEVFGLLGANGAGKTTLIECILGTKIPNEGTVELLSLNIKKDRKKLFELIGVQFQDSNYQDKIKVSELCEETYSLYKNPADYLNLLEEFKLIDLKDHLVSSLSGGERQRLFIVLALISNPKVVFLDELTTGLDARSRRDVWKYLERLKQEGLTILLTSHFMDEVEHLCDKIMILRNGKLVFEGTVKEAVTKSNSKTLEEAYLKYTDEEEDK